MPVELKLEGKTYRRVTDLVKARRQALGLTQADVARKLGITSPDFISLAESGKRSFALDRIPALASILHLNAKDLLYLALGEEHPELAQVLKAGKSSTGLTILEDEAEMIERARRLSSSARKTVFNMIEHLAAVEEHRGARED